MEKHYKIKQVSTGKFLGEKYFEDRWGKIYKTLPNALKVARQLDGGPLGEVVVVEFTATETAIHK